MTGATYKVYADLNLRSDATRELARITAALGLLDTKIKATHKAATDLMTRLGSLGTGRMNQGLRQASSALDSLRQSAGGASTAMSRLRPGIAATHTALGTMAQASTAASSATQGLSRSLGGQRRILTRIATVAHNAAREMRALAAVPPPSPIPPPPPGWNRRRRRDADHDEGGRGRFFLRPSYSEGISTIRAGASGVGAVLDAAGERQQAETMLRASGMPENERRSILAAAPGIARQVPGTTVLQAINAYREARNVSNNHEAALAMAPDLLRTGRLAAATTGRPIEDALRPFTRALAIRGTAFDDQGHLDMRAFRSELEELQNATIAFATGSHGEGVDPREWEQFFKQGGIAGRRMSMRSVVGPMGSLIQEQGGQRAGTMASAFYDQIVSGVLRKETANHMRADGFFQSGPRAVQYEDTLMQRLVREGKMTPEEVATARERRRTAPEGAPILGRGLATVRPDLWMQEVFADLARQHGHTTQDSQLDYWDSMRFRQTNRRFGMSMLQTAEVQNDIETVNRVRRMRDSGQDPTGIVLNEGYTNAMANLTSSFRDLLASLGNAPSVVPFINELGRSIRDMADWAQAHPGFMEGMVSDLRQFGNELRQFASDLTAVVADFKGVFDTLRSIKAALGSISAIQLGTDVAHFINQARQNGIVSAITGRPPGPQGPPAPPEGVPTTPRAAPSIELTPPAPSLVPVPGAGMQRNMLSPGIHLQNFDTTTPSAQQAVQPVILHLDGREVGRGVMPHLGREASGPLQGTARFDGLRAMPSQEGVSA